MDQTPPIPPPPGSSLFEMDLDAVGQNHLNTVSKWGKFISITLLVIVLLFLLVLATQYEELIARLRELMSMDNQAAGIIIGIMIAFVVLILALLFFMLRGCSLIKQGLVAQNSDRIADGFRSLKVVFTIGIIFTILTILITVLNLVTN